MRNPARAIRYFFFNILVRYRYCTILLSPFFVVRWYSPLFRHILHPKKNTCALTQGESKRDRQTYWMHRQTWQTDILERQTWKTDKRTRRTVVLDKQSYSTDKHAQQIYKYSTKILNLQIYWQADTLDWLIFSAEALDRQKCPTERQTDSTDKHTTYFTYRHAHICTYIRNIYCTYLHPMHTHTNTHFFRYILIRYSAIKMIVRWIAEQWRYGKSKVSTCGNKLCYWRLLLDSIK